MKKIKLFEIILLYISVLFHMQPRFKQLLQMN